MTPERVEQLLWGMTAVAALSCALVMQREARALRPQVVHGAPSMTAAAIALPISRTEEDRMDVILDGDLFSRDRQAVDSAPPPPPVIARPPAPPKPRLVLQGLIGGPPWDAIVQGIPGHEGSYVVRAGDSVSGLKIRSVKRDGATIRGMDTTWILTLRRAP